MTAAIQSTHHRPPLSELTGCIAATPSTNESRICSSVTRTKAMDEASGLGPDVERDHHDQQFVKSSSQPAVDEGESQNHHNNRPIPPSRPAESMVTAEIGVQKSGQYSEGNGTHMVGEVGASDAEAAAVVMNGGNGMMSEEGDSTSEAQMMDGGNGAGAMSEGSGEDGGADISSGEVPTVKGEPSAHEADGSEPAAMDVDHPEATAANVKSDGGEGGPSSPEPSGGEGGLPPPCEPPSFLAPCLRGKLHAVADGRHVCKGLWAMKRSDHDLEGDALALNTNRFEFSIVPPSPESVLPVDGTYQGFFWITLKKLVKYDDTCHLQFTPNSEGGWNISGSGKNQCGSYQISGTVSPEMNLELFRLFDHLLKGRSASKSSRKSTTSRKNAAPSRPSGDFQVPPPVLNLDGVSVSSVGADSTVSHLTESTGFGLQHRHDAGVAVRTTLDTGIVPRLPSLGSITVMGNAIGVSKAGRVIKTKVPLVQDDDRARPDRLTAKCLEILGRLMKQPASYLFNEPVNPERDQCPDYYHVITTPMDFGTIKQRLEVLQYTSPEAFAEDVRLVFQNAVRYNARPEHFVNKAAVQLSNFFENRFSAAFPVVRQFDGYDEEHEGAGGMLQGNGRQAAVRKSFGGGGGAAARAGKKRQRVPDLNDLGGDFMDDDLLPLDDDELVYYGEDLEGAYEPPPPEPKPIKKTRPASYGGGGSRKSGGGAGGSRKSTPAAPAGDSKVTMALLQRIEALEKEVKSKTAEPQRILTYEDKKNLSKSIEQLPVEKAAKVIKIIQSRMDLSVGAEEVEIDIDTLPNDTLLELQAYVNKCTQPRRGGGPRGGLDGKKRKGSSFGGDSDEDFTDDEF